MSLINKSYVLVPDTQDSNVTNPTLLSLARVMLSKIILNARIDKILLASLTSSCIEFEIHKEGEIMMHCHYQSLLK